MKEDGAARATPAARHRAGEWLLIGGALMLAIASDWSSPGPGGSGSVAYVVAALPMAVTYLVFRSWLASAIVGLAPLYFVIGLVTRDWPAHRPELSIDGWFPLQPAWTLVYGSLYAFILLMPLFVIRDPALLRRAAQAFLAVMLAAYACFLAYPTMAPRPERLAGEGFGVWCLRIVYDIDPPHGCLPSLHVAYSFVSALAVSRVHRGVGAVALAWAALISVSTIYTKQHFVLDVIAGVALACGAAFVFLRPHPRAASTGADARGAPRRALAVAGVYAVMLGGFWAVFAISR